MTGQAGSGDAERASLAALLEGDPEDLYDNAPCGYLSTYPDGVIAKVNRTLLDWIGYEREQLVGRRRFADLLTAGGRIYHETHYAPLLRMQGSVREIALDLVRRDGRRLPVLVNSVLKVDEVSGQPLITRTTVFDVTDRRAYERELLRARDVAERSEARLRTLEVLIARVAAASTKASVAAAVVEAGGEAYGADGGVLWPVGPDGRAGKPLAAAGVADPASIEAPLTGEPVGLGSPGEAARLPAAAALMRSQGWQSLLLVPLVANARPVGLLAWGFGEARAMPDEERELLVTLGRQIGLALERVRLQEEVVQHGRRSALLLEASSVLAVAADYAETLERLAAVAVPALGELCLVDVVAEDGRLVRMAARHADPRRQALVDELRRRYPPEPGTGHPAVAAMASREVQWSAEMGEEFLLATTRDEQHYELARALDLQGYLSVPLVAGGRALGSLTILSTGSGRRFERSDAVLAEELARQVSLVVDRAERYDRDRRTSHALQAGLLPPRPPQVPGLSIAVRYLPGTRGVDVGGDFYDVIELPGDAVAVAVGDVAGHDITAAATMGQLRSVSRALIADVEGPAALVRRLQDSWALLGIDRMATAVYAVLDRGSGRLRIASAGHLAPMVLHEGTCRPVDLEPAAPLGAPTTPVEEWTSTLPRGASLLMFTDGLVESRHQDIDVGIGHLAGVAAAAGTADPELLCDAILREVAGDDRGDDVALLIITRK
ncbi:MAG: SpoIIE family protein phosphatase [Frankiaceae bacterium]